MALFIPGKVTKKRRRAALHAALHASRERLRTLRVDGDVSFEPDPPLGYSFLVGADGALLVDANGVFLIGVS